jgi:DNA-binding LacI/PurR family transcriptional regulator
MATMLERLANPEAAPRDVLLYCRLIVRQSCGAHMAENLE